MELAHTSPVVERFLCTRIILKAEFVAWQCRIQDQQDGAILLADGQAIIHAMGTNAEYLHDVEIRVPPQLPRQKRDRANVWDGERLYYAPWYPVVSTSNKGQLALDMFESLLAVGCGHRRIRLREGEMLVVGFTDATGSQRTAIDCCNVIGFAEYLCITDLDQKSPFYVRICPESITASR